VSPCSRRETSGQIGHGSTAERPSAVPPSTRQRVNPQASGLSIPPSLGPPLVAIIKACSPPPRDHLHARQTRRHSNMDISSLLPSLSRAPSSFLPLLHPVNVVLHRPLPSGEIDRVSLLPFFPLVLYSCRFCLPIRRRHRAGLLSRTLSPLSSLPLDASDAFPLLPHCLRTRTRCSQIPLMNSNSHLPLQWIITFLSMFPCTCTFILLPYFRTSC